MRKGEQKVKTNMKKEKIAQGLNSLLATPQPTQTGQEQTQTLKKPKVVKKAICVTVPVDIVDDVNYIAYYDRRKLNAVVTDALTEYVKKWKPAAQEQPRDLKNIKK